MQRITFPAFSGVRCLMMPYIQGDADSVPEEYQPYREILNTVFLKKGDLGFLTIDELPLNAGAVHRGARAAHSRALHTEAGRHPDQVYQWGGGHWGHRAEVLLDRAVRILLANNVDDSCAVWDVEHEATSLDGDIGHAASEYPLQAATMIKAGEVHNIGILTPHESRPVARPCKRQFLRILSSGVHGREPYFTKNERCP